MTAASDLRVATGEPRLTVRTDETTAAVGISRPRPAEPVRIGQVGSTTAGRRRLISRGHHDTFPAGDRA